MEISYGKSSFRFLLFFFFMIFILFITSSLGEDPQKAPERPSFSKFIQETVSIWKKSHQTYLEKMKNIFHQMQLQFSPPNLDFRSRDDSKGSNGIDEDGVGGKMKEAVGKSFGASKDAVEECAKSAAKVVEEAVHKTADKIKENLPDKELSHDEL